MSESKDLVRSKGRIVHNKKTYMAWYNMVDRCTNQLHAAYSRYGGKGITVCERWLKFRNFLLDMGDCPKNLTLERKDGLKGYNPENCIWASWARQQGNRRYGGKHYVGV